jgi:hypothetical protein
MLGVPASAASADGGPIMPLSQVQAGMDCSGDTVVQGTTITSFNVHVINVVQTTGEGPRIMVSVSGPAVDATGIAQGFSGSPVYCQDALGTMRNIGAISEGVGQYGNNVGLVTPIEQMLGESVKPPASAPRLSVRTRPLLGPLMVGGLSPGLLALLQRAGASAGRTVLAVPVGGPASSFPLQPLVPGASVSISYSSGAIPMGGIGTVTYRDGQNVYAFGHELDGAGRRSLLLGDAYVYYVVSNPGVLGTSYKFASPGHIEGTMTNDTPNAVIGVVGPTPATVPIHVAVRDLDTGGSLTLDSQVADETDVGTPLGASPVSLVSPLEIGQAATQIFNGPPANESGRMCLRVALRESRVPLQFCNRYVGTAGTGTAGLAPPELALAASSDAATALGLIDQVQFAALHVTGVSAQISAQRGLAEATLVSAHGPARVRPGRTVTVRATVRLYRGGLRTISLRLRVPRNAHGLLVATLRGPDSPIGAAGAAQNLQQSLTLTFGGGGPSPGPAPSSIASLRKAFAGIANYDGLMVTFGLRKPQRAYRDGALLINGNARMKLLVVR